MSRAQYDNLHRSVLQEKVNTTANLNVHAQVDGMRRAQNWNSSMAKQQAKMDAYSRANIARHASMVSSVNTGIASNQYIEDILTKEGSRIRHSDRMVKNEQMKMRQNILEKSYQKEYYRMATMCTVATIFVLLLLVTLTVMVGSGFLSMFLFWVILVILVTIYLIAMVVTTRRIARLRETSDGIYRWNVDSEIRAELRDVATTCGRRKPESPSCR